ncbi:TonB-dependent receptor [Geofilum rubicundum JCM 15548]|uniref:TonB-dependent receptor n=1 Tax=Geofilum rubicundum JCM 15548 TaxID=1236989 RepID=A0A0E9M116_9BACT|nr:TonB-dependent receptor [Geofilum rubicundum JCM 15548]
MLAFGLMLVPLSLKGQNSGEADSLTYIKVLVKDAHTGAPISAAQARTLNFPAAGTTNDEGVMNIGVVSLNDVLEVRAYFYDPAEVPLRGRTEVEVSLFPEFFSDFVSEEEGLLGKTRASHNMLSSRKLKAHDPLMAVSADALIQSYAGGEIRSISRSGTSGIGNAMFIRGFNSVNMNSQPLIVVDGVILNTFYNEASLHQGYFGNKLADIDVNDIESINLLKDGSGLYGSKGANGVIDIRTRRGKSMVTKIEFNAFGGVTQRSGSDIPMMDGDAYRIYTSELLGTTNLSASDISELPFLQGDPSAIGYNRYHNNTDWNDEVYRNGIVHGYNIGVDGGDERALYAFSIGYMGETGVVKNTNMERLSTRFNADFNLSDYIDLGLNVGFSNVDRDLLDDGVNFYTSPTYLARIKSPFLNPYTYTTGGTETSIYENSDIFGISNPTGVIGFALNTNKHYRLNVGMRPSFKLTPELTLSTLFDYSLDKNKETYYSPKDVVALRKIEGFGMSENVFRSQVIRNIAMYDDTRLEYKKILDGRHRINGVLGWRYLFNDYRLEYGEGHNSGSNQKRNLMNELEFRQIIGVNSSSKYMSTYLNADYSLDNKYFLSLAAAMDGSSKFGKETIGGIQFLDRSWALFPSVNAGWLISSESFMGNRSLLNHLKLRLGYSITGNDDIDPYASHTYLTSTRYLDRANGLVIGNMGNEQVQWETTSKMNVGLDAQVFNNRLALNVDFYQNQTKDLLALRAYPEVLGQGFYWNNEGELQNTGVELVANWKILNFNQFKWELGASVGHYQNEITSLPEGRFITSIFGAEILTSEGQAAGVFYGYKTNGVISSEEEVMANPTYRIDDVSGAYYLFTPGDVAFVDQVEDGVIDEKDKQVIGDPNPDFYGSFSTRMGLGNFTLSALFNFSYGNEIYNYLRSNLESGKDFSNQTVTMLDRWTAEGQPATQPRAVFGDPMGNSRFSDRWIEDGSFLRFKTLTLSYKIPVNTQAFEAIEIWASGNNLWTLTDYLGTDPEVSAGNAVLYQGIDRGFLPGTKSFVVGVKLNL